MARCRTALLAAAALGFAGCGGSGAPKPAAPAPVATQAVATCNEAAYTPEQGTRFIHPSQNFYAPGDPGTPTPDDIQHLLLADNAIVVTYPAHASQPTRDQLAEWAATQIAAVVVPDPAPDAAPVAAMIATAKLTCDGLDTEQLSAFGDRRGTGAAVPHDAEG